MSSITAATTLPRPGRVVCVEHLASMLAVPGERVRVTGRLAARQSGGLEFFLEDEAFAVRVDLSSVPADLLARADAHAGSMVQIIGDVEDGGDGSGGGSLVVRAQIVRSMQGVNMELYRKSIDMMTRFLRGF
jgi:hypothetical protein